MLFWVWLSFIFLSVLLYSLRSASKIDLYCLPDLYLRRTDLSLLVAFLLRISVLFKRGLVFQASSSLIIYWTEYSFRGSSLLAFFATQLIIYFCWIKGSHLSGLHSNSVDFLSFTHGALHIKMALLSLPSLTSTKPRTNTLVFPHMKH